MSKSVFIACRHSVADASAISHRSVTVQSNFSRIRSDFGFCLFLSVFELFLLSTGRNASATRRNASATGRNAINTVDDVSKIGCRRVEYWKFLTDFGWRRVRIQNPSQIRQNPSKKIKKNQKKLKFDWKSTKRRLNADWSDSDNAIKEPPLTKYWYLI